MNEIPSILQKILSVKAQEVAAKKQRQDEASLSAEIAGLPAARGFAERIRQLSARGPAVIAEIKKASPSAGVIRNDFQPADIAASYEAAGAACLSVLTDQRFFQGADEYLALARNACSLPVLRKEFIIDPWQLYESRVLGADCVLLIVAALEKGRLQALDGLARALGMDVLVEVHDERELEAALDTGASLVGVNNRDLNTFSTDLSTSERLKPLIPEQRTMITESGIHSRDDVGRMMDAGITAFLVGEAFMRAENPGHALKSLFSDGDCP
jgi:indole-3-glycerol phosphate synthase